MSSRAGGVVLIAGFIARALAATDRDVDAGIAAYEKGEHEEALARFDAAQERRGERSEIHYDRGLALQASGQSDPAREALERGTESDEGRVRASSHYQLGNLAFAAEQWDEAIEQYKSCLRADPSHQNAKWNLELALQRKKTQEEQEQQKQEQQKQPEPPPDPQDSGEEETGSEEEQDSETGGEPPEEEAADTGDGAADRPPSEEGDKPTDPPTEEPSPADPQPAPAQPLERTDLDAALEQLDAADQFMLGQPVGRPAEVKEDW